MISKDILDKLKELEYVYGVLLIGNDGLVKYSSLLEDDSKIENLGAELSIILNGISQVMKNLYNENAECIFIKVKNQGIMLVPKDGEILTIMFKVDNNNLQKLTQIMEKILND